MAFTKIQRAEKAVVLTKDAHKRIGKALSKIGKSSAKELTDEEREEFSRSLDKP